MSFIGPTLPQSQRTSCRPLIICGRKPRRRPKNPSPQPVRPLPSLPPLPRTPLLSKPPPPNSPVPLSSSKLLIKTLQSRRDAVVLNATPHSPVATAVSCRENSEHALILLPARTTAVQIGTILSDPANRPHHSRKTRVIVAAGRGYGGWKHSAMNANSSTHSVIVVGTPRALFNEFFNSHGLPWLQRVRFLVVACVGEMLENGCVKDLYRIVGRISPNRKTVIVNEDMNEGVKKMVDEWLRPKHGVIEWGEALPKPIMPTVVDGSVITARPMEVLEYLVKVVDSRKKTERVVVLFAAARVLEVYATMLRTVGRQVIDIHARTSLGNRARGLESLNEGGVLLATDTVVDVVKDVDLVVSVGVTDEETYRTRAAAGKRCTVVVRREISEFMKFAGAGAAQAWERQDGAVDVDMARKGVGEKARRVGYQSMVAIYGSWRKRLGWTRPQVVEFATEWAKEMFGEAPEIDKKFAGRRRMIGCKDVRIRQPVKETVISGGSRQR